MKTIELLNEGVLNKDGIEAVEKLINDFEKLKKAFAFEDCHDCDYIYFKAYTKLEYDNEIQEIYNRDRAFFEEKLVNMTVRKFKRWRKEERKNYHYDKYRFSNKWRRNENT